MRSEVGEFLQKIRKARNMTQGDLAKRANISLSSLQRYETGERDINISNLSKIASALDIDPENITDELFSDEEGDMRRSELFMDMYNKYLTGAGKEKVYEYTKDLIGNPKYLKLDIKLFGDDLARDKEKSSR